MSPAKRRPICHLFRNILHLLSVSSWFVNDENIALYFANKQKYVSLTLTTLIYISYGPNIKWTPSIPLWIYTKYASLACLCKYDNSIKARVNTCIENMFLCYQNSRCLRTEHIQQGYFNEHLIDEHLINIPLNRKVKLQPPLYITRSSVYSIESDGYMAINYFLSSYKIEYRMVCI